jgi:hypothetical protein
MHTNLFLQCNYQWKNHGLQTLREEIAFTARPKINSQSQIFRYGHFVCHIGPIFQNSLTYAFIAQWYMRVQRVKIEVFKKYFLMLFQLKLIILDQ